MSTPSHNVSPVRLMPHSTTKRNPAWWRNPVVIVMVGCLIAMTGFGIRSTFGLFLEPMTLARGWGRETFALAMAIQNLLWGIGVPIAGAIADRRGAAPVLILGSIAYAVGMILIYLLVVAQFRSYVVPLIIMAPIPLTIIGVMPGHALFGANFTATSMIGMIALAGIIVRNSILLVDFINQEVAAGVAFEEAVIRAGAVRAKPIALTAAAAMLGAFFILDDPIFNGLAVSLIFGIFVSTLLTLVVIPVLYYAFGYSRE